MIGFPYTSDATPGAAVTLGLIVLQVDETIESDFRRLFPDTDVALHVTRIPSGAELTQATIARMEAELPRAAALLPQAPLHDAVGYACTSGTTLIGADRVAALVGGACRTRAVCDPLTGAIAACTGLNARRIALVSPYAPAIAAPVRAAIEAAGIAVTRAVSFGEEIEANVARIDRASLCAAVREAACDDAEAVFISCTNLRTLDAIPVLEAELGRPVFGSNLALAWAMADAAGAAMSGFSGPAIPRPRG